MQEAEIAGVAGSLSKAQREAMTAGGPFATSIPKLTGASCRCALQRRGLVVDRMYATAMTDFGLQVRAHLQRTQGESRAKETPDAE